jgi:hypothetical protein
MSVARLDSFQLKAYISPAWVDITADKIGDINVQDGINGRGPGNCLADSGYMKFSLDNSAYTYSPDSAHVLTGWEKGIPVALIMTYEGTEIVKWRGMIDKIELSTVVEDINRANVTALGWFDYALKYPLVSPTTLLNKTADEAITAIVAMMPIAPAATDLDVGYIEFVALFDTVTTSTTAYREFEKIAQAEGYIYMRRDPVYGETLVFENMNARPGTRVLDGVPYTKSTTGALIKQDGGYIRKQDGGKILIHRAPKDIIISGASGGEASPLGVKVVYGEDIINSMKITVYPKRTDTSAQILYRLGSPMEIGSGETKTFRGNYTDPTGGGATANAISSTMITPVATTDYLMWTASDGTGTNLTAYLSVTVVYGTEAPAYTVTNTSSYLAYITKLQARGYGIYSDNPIETNQENAASYLKYGYQTASKRELLQRDVIYAEAEAKSIIEREKLPRTVLTEVSLEANSCEELMMIFLNCDIGYLVGVQSDRSEIDGRYYIQRITYTVTPGGLINYTWDVVQSFSLYSGLTLISAEFATREVVPAVPAGADPYTVSLLHTNGADGSTTITDEVAGKTWTAYNGAQIDTAIKKLGSGSCLFDGVNDYISTDPSEDFNFGSENFTIEWFEYRVSSADSKWTMSLQNADWDANHLYWAIGIKSGGDLCVSFASNGNLTYDIANYKSLGTVSLNAWTHHAITRDGSTFRCFKDGVLTDTWTSTIAFGAGSSSATLQIGRFKVGATEVYTQMQADEVRISKGICRYTADFTPPVAEFVATTPAVAAIYGGGALNFGHVPQITDLTIRTISTWLYFDKVEKAYGTLAPLFMYTEDENALSGNTLYLYSSPTHVSAYFVTGGFATAGAWTVANAFLRLTWVHILVSYEIQNASANPYIYVDGSLTSFFSSTLPTGAVKSEGGCTLKIGARKTTLSDYTDTAMTAQIKDYRIYNRLPSATERALLVSEGPGGASVTSGLVFQTPCVYTKQLASYIDQDITATNRILDNVYGNIGDGKKSQVGITGIYPVGRAI